MAFGLQLAMSSVAAASAKLASCTMASISLMPGGCAGCKKKGERFYLSPHRDLSRLARENDFQGPVTLLIGEVLRDVAASVPDSERLLQEEF